MALLAAPGTGLIDEAALVATLEGLLDKPGVIAVAHGNNEIGTLQSLAALAERVHVYSHSLHVDATKSAGRNVGQGLTGRTAEWWRHWRTGMQPPARLGLR